jgi:hypothetical protein
LEDLELRYGGGATRPIVKPSTNLAESLVGPIRDEETPVHIHDPITFALFETDERTLPCGLDVEPGSGAIPQLGPTPRMDLVPKLEAAAPTQTLEKNPTFRLDLSLWLDVHHGATAA